MDYAKESLRLHGEWKGKIEVVTAVPVATKDDLSLAHMLVSADVFVGMSAPGTVTTEMVKTINKDTIVFACANPTPEIFPDDAKAGGAAVVSTGRSDFPNQINNVLAFPSVFRGTFDVRASDINEEMKMAAANALAKLISDEELNADYIIPKAFDPRVGPAVAKAVAEAPASPAWPASDRYRGKATGLHSKKTARRTPRCLFCACLSCTRIV